MEQDISILRVCGIFAGALITSVILFRLIFLRKRLGPSLTSLIFGIVLCVVSVFPSLVTGGARLLNLDSIPGGRLIVLLMLAFLGMWLRMNFLKSATRSLRNSWLEVLISGLARDAIDKWKSRGEDLSTIHTLIVVPALNEVDNLSHFLPELTANLEDAQRVLVVDDGSSDGTAEFAEEAGTLVIRNPKNLGGGIALRAGFEVAKLLDIPVILTLDADGQHEASEIPNLLAPIRDESADIVVGSRQLGETLDTDQVRNLGVRVFSQFLSILTREKLTDCSSGFRAIRTDVLRKLTLEAEQYHTTELLIKAQQQGFRLSEVPITVKPRIHGESRKGANPIYAFRFLRSIISTWIR